MRGKFRLGSLFALLSLLLIGLTSSVSAERFTGGSYQIDASVIGNSFGGSQSGGSYQLTSSGGESIIGQGSGGSYKLDSGYVAQLQKSLQLTVQPGNMVAYYALDEPSGSFIRDSSINSINGTLGASTYRDTGKIGAGIDVSSAAGGVVTVPDSSTLPSGGTMTLEVWVNQDTLVAYKTIASHWDYTAGTPTSGSWALQSCNADQTRLCFFVASTPTDPGNNYAATPAGSWSTIAVWRHVAVVYDGSLAAANRVAIYIDGVKQTTAVTGAIPSALLNAAAPLNIGDFYGLNRQYNGKLDEFKLFSRALSADEVKAEYDAGQAGNTAGLSFAADIAPGVSQTSPFDAAVLTDAKAYSLAINQNQNLTKGADTIPAVSGSIGSPVAWVEGTTKGLGFTLFGTNATAIPGTWNSGNSYAAFPGTATTFYNRTGQGTKDIVNMRLRLDVTTAQPAGTYTNVITTTGTMTP